MAANAPMQQALTDYRRARRDERIRRATRIIVDRLRLDFARDNLVQWLDGDRHPSEPMERACRELIAVFGKERAGQIVNQLVRERLAQVDRECLMAVLG